ncbi:MAG: hypothetical protein QX197_02780 [Methylococcaceae bacterium]
MLRINKYSYLTLMLPLLSACVSLPTGPSVMVLAGSGKNFEQFRYDDRYCKQFASEQLGGGTAQQAAVSSGVGSAIVGTGVGAGAGAAIGGGSGAAIGAGSGLVLGSVAGSGAANLSGYEAQQYYDASFIQCMYALGHRVPVSGQITNDATVNRSQQPPNLLPPPPPPPAGNPPPPPPR